jgi:hypothetical protein
MINLVLLSASLFLVPAPVSMAVCKTVSSRACASCTGASVSQCKSGSDYESCTTSYPSCSQGGVCASASGSGTCGSAMILDVNDSQAQSGSRTGVNHGGVVSD